MRLIWGILIALALCGSANATGIVAMSTKHCTSASSCQLTTATNDCPIGSTAVLFAGINAATVTLSSVIDSAGNSWAVIQNNSNNGVTAAWAYAAGTALDIPIGATITANFAGGSAASGLIAGCISAGNTNDTNMGQTNTGTAATSSTALTSGSTKANNELLLGGIVLGAGSSGQSCTGTISTQFQTQGTQPVVGTCVLQVATSGSTRTMAESWTTSANYVQNIIGIYQAAPSARGMLLLGVP